jgi:hypothetical protein
MAEPRDRDIIRPTGTHFRPAHLFFDLSGNDRNVAEYDDAFEKMAAAMAAMNIGNLIFPSLLLNIFLIVPVNTWRIIMLNGLCHI